MVDSKFPALSIRPSHFFIPGCKRTPCSPYPWSSPARHVFFQAKHSLPPGAAVQCVCRVVRAGPGAPIQSVYLGMPRDLLHPTEPIVGISPHGDNQGVLDVLARRALLLRPARSLPALDVLADSVLKPVLGGKRTSKQGHANLAYDKYML